MEPVLRQAVAEALVATQVVATVAALAAAFVVTSSAFVAAAPSSLETDLQHSFGFASLASVGFVPPDVASATVVKPMDLSPLLEALVESPEASLQAPFVIASAAVAATSAVAVGASPSAAASVASQTAAMDFASAAEYWRPAAE